MVETREVPEVESEAVPVEASGENGVHPGSSAVTRKAVRTPMSHHVDLCRPSRPEMG